MKIHSTSILFPCGNTTLQTRCAHWIPRGVYLPNESTLVSSSWCVISTIYNITLSLLSPDFNCNSFTSDVIGFLTGGSIPSWIKGFRPCIRSGLLAHKCFHPDLPADFLSTPFGAALRPTIDSMFRRPTSGTVSPQPFSQPAASSLLQSVATQATGPDIPQQSYQTSANAAPISHPAAGTVAAPLQICSNLQHFRNILSSHRAVSAFFTSRTCPPCRIVEPVFEDMAWQKASKGVAFVKIDLGAMLGGDVARVYGITATPTFLFFLDGRKIHELKGADVPELRSQVDLLIHQAFPRKYMCNAYC